MKKKVAIGLLGSTLDQGFSADRWNRWRPSVCVCQQEELLIEKFHLLYQKEFSRLSNHICKDITHVSPETEIITHEISFNDPWDFEEVYEALYNFAENHEFDLENYEYLFHITTGTHVAQICFFLLTESHHFPGKLLQTSPSKDSCGTYSIIDLDLSKYDSIAKRFQLETIDDISFLKSGIKTKNRIFNELIDRIEYVALRTTDPILLSGPTGAGKSQLANRIFALKKNRKTLTGDFIEVNCATLRGDAAISALFGHKKGAFTGALVTRTGLLKAADKGILFLDEIGELGLDEQAMLLRAIEEKKFMPLGSDKEEESDFQLICGTNRNLHHEVADKNFREDLLARINLWTFNLPGLKERTEDIEPNIQYELKRYEEKNSTHTTFSKEAKEQFLNFAVSKEAVWSANFRDLNGAMIRMCTLAPGGRITSEIVMEEIERLKASWSKNDEIEQDDILENYLTDETSAAIDPFDRVQLNYVIKTCRASKTLSDAGRKLFSSSRKSKTSSNDADRLKKYLSRFSLDWKDIV
jgi:transcriptional regulatory protein RtcR